ncbi:MAG: hypothetical protein JWO30_4755 [Fibrobacteres bacterium]|nr:hypothetical protein [Fibrobacterota bacterium]
MKRMRMDARIILAIASALAALPAMAESQPALADAPAPAFYYNTLGQPWQSVAPGLLDWENTVGYVNVHTFPASSGASSASSASSVLALTSLVTGLASWADIAGVVGGTLANPDDIQESGFFGGTGHLAWDLGSDNGLALYVGPAWSFDGKGISSSSLSVTAATGHEPSAGWSRDFNLGVNYTDQGSFSAVVSPDITDLWTGTLLASAGRVAADRLSSFSVEGFGAYSSGDLIQDAGLQSEGSAWRLGGGVGYQRSFGGNPSGLNAWALYGGLQWEWADIGDDQDPTSPSLVVNFSIGTIRPR